MSKKFIKPEVVRAALQRLRAAQIHEHFAGYLCVQKGLTEHPKTPVVSQEFKVFFDTYLKVDDAAPNFPYVKVFTNGKPNGSQWINKNVSGSYAPSSIRPNQPLGRIVTVTGTKSAATYGLVGSHEKAVLAELLAGYPIPAFELATFLYRDFSFQSTAEPADLVSIFRKEFGFEEGSTGGTAFATIFIPYRGTIKSDQFFEDNVDG